MMNFMECFLCGSEISYLEVVKNSLEWNGDEWVKDDQAEAVIRCPDCGDELDAGDLAIMKIPIQLIESVTQ
jgi:DNA-directed RNA polymerase subunit RPC12/RpoP